MTKQRDEYAWWRAACEGDFGPIHEGKPEPGFYRMKKGDDQVPVAIWRAEVVDNDGNHSSKMMALVGDDEESNPYELWLYCCKHPVTEDAYNKRREAGAWPNEAAGIGHNEAPASDFMELADNRLGAANKWLDQHEKIASQDEADQASGYIKGLRDAYQKLDDQRKDEKAPHLQASRDVDEKFRGHLRRLETLGKQINRLLSAYLAEQQRKADEERRKAEEARRKAEAEGQEPPEEPMPEPTRAKAGGQHSYGGKPKRAMSLRTYHSAKVTDPKKAAAYYAKNPKVIAAIEQVASAAMRADESLEIPGIERITEQRAA